MSARASPGPPRGVLRRRAREGDVEHRRVLPRGALRESVAHFWWVSWRLDAPLLVETAPHPCVHVVAELPNRRVEVAGVQSRRFTRTLEGTGRALGVKFRPAAFQPLLGGPVASLRDRVVSLTAALPAGGRALRDAMLADADLDVLASLAESALGALVRELPKELVAVRDLVERTEIDRTILRAEDLASIARLPVRTLERRFRALVGASPKWVIRRYRLIEAAEQLAAGRESVASVAATLGYFDQSHFVRDFRAFVGRTPSGYGAEEGAPRGV